MPLCNLYAWAVVTHMLVMSGFPFTIAENDMLFTTATSNGYGSVLFILLGVVHLQIGNEAVFVGESVCVSFKLCLKTYEVKTNNDQFF